MAIHLGGMGAAGVVVSGDMVLQRVRVGMDRREEIHNGVQFGYDNRAPFSALREGFDKLFRVIDNVYVTKYQYFITD